MSRADVPKRELELSEDGAIVHLVREIDYLDSELKSLFGRLNPILSTATPDAVKAIAAPRSDSFLDEQIARIETLRESVISITRRISL